MSEALSGMTIWMVIILSGLVTLALRLSFIELAGRISLPDAFTRALRFVPAAVLAAIIMPALLATPGGGLDLSLMNPKLIAGAIAAFITWRTGSMLITIFIGLPLLWVLQWWLA
ncbi:MAG: AzlD domain-containing protein [Parvibaculum sp.]